MLDMGFIHAIRQFLKLLPRERQNLMCSATYSEYIRELAGRLLRNPVAIEVAARNAAAERIEQHVYRVPKEHKRHLLAHLIVSGNWHQVLVFTRTKHGANRLTEQLVGSGVRAAAIHGNKSQGARVRALADFKENRITALVATEVAPAGSISRSCRTWSTTSCRTCPNTTCTASVARRVPVAPVRPSRWCRRTRHPCCATSRNYCGAPCRSQPCRPIRWRQPLPRARRSRAWPRSPVLIGTRGGAGRPARDGARHHAAALRRRPHPSRARAGRCSRHETRAVPERLPAGCVMTELAWVALRAASLVLLFQAAGAALFSAAFGQRLAHSAPAIRRTGVRAAAGALAALGAQYLLEPVHLAGEWAGIADASLHRLVLSSSTGAALAMRAAGVAAVALGLRYDGLAARSAAAAGGLSALGSFALTGHSAVDPHRLLLAPLLLVHLMLAAFWFGSLWPLRQLCALEPRAQAARVIEAFSSGALWLVPLIPLAGAGIAAVLLPGFAALLAPYGLLLGAKLMLFAALMGLAALNRLRLTPALARGEPGALPRLRRSLAAEYVLVCAVLTVTAVLTGFFSPAQTERDATAGPPAMARA